MEEHGFLQDKTDLVSQRFLLKFPDVGSINLHGSCNWIVESRDQANDAGFPGSRRAHKSRNPARFNSEADILENGCVWLVLEADMFEFNFPLELRRADCPDETARG